MELCRPHAVDHAHNARSNACSLQHFPECPAKPQFSYSRFPSSWPESISCACLLPCPPSHLSARISAFQRLLQVTQGNNLQFAALLALNGLILFATFLALGIVLSVVGKRQLDGCQDFRPDTQCPGESFSLALQRQPLELALRILCRTAESSDQSSNGSRIRIVSSRSGDVERRATGHSISSSRYFTYLMACAGSCAHERAPAVVSFQPSKFS